MRDAGKKIGNAFYIHRSAVGFIGLVEIAKEHLPSDFNYEVIKINEKEQAVSFIESHDWNEADEPTVGDSYKVDVCTGKTSFRKGRRLNPQIYHHKWMFVNDDYTGFNVEESKARSKLWQSSGIDYDSKKIGNRNYWNEVVVSKLSNTKRILEDD